MHVGTSLASIHSLCSLSPAPLDYEPQTHNPQYFLDVIRAEPLLELVGVHSHLGSTITKVSQL